MPRNFKADLEQLPPSSPPEDRDKLRLYKGETVTWDIQLEGVDLSLQLRVENIGIIDGMPSVEISYDRKWWRHHK